MTVSVEATTSGPYTASGTATVFPFTFRAQATDEVAVLVNGIEQSAGFTVTLSTDASGNLIAGGSVTFTVPPTAGAVILIASKPSYQQQVSFEDAGQFLPSTHDLALDRAAIRDLDLRARSNRSLRAPVGEILAELPSASSRAGKYLSFDSMGAPLMSSGPSGGGGGGSGTLADGTYGDIAVSGTGTVMMLGNGKVSLAKMADLAANSILGNNTGSAATPLALTGAQVTAMLNAVVGDSGAGGTKGLVPAPATGDGAAGKYLDATGAWSIPPSSGGTGNTTNALTFNNSGTGVASGTTFNGSVARTVSWNTIGAAPLASPAFTGTPTAPTATAKTATTALATTAFVDALRSFLDGGTGAGKTLDITDRGAMYLTTGAVTVPANIFAARDVVVVYNNSAAGVSLAQGASLTLRWSGTATTGTRTILQRGTATIVFISATEAVVSGDLS